MRLTIVPIDSVVCKDGECLHDIDLTWVPEEVHAVQWYDDHGEVEYVDLKRINEEITSLGLFERAAELWDAKKKQIEDEAIQAELNRDYWQELRYIRFFKLTECDWTQLPDNNLTEEQKVIWQGYRQELRDLPDNITDPKALVLDSNHPDWPVPPA